MCSTAPRVRVLPRGRDPIFWDTSTYRWKSADVIHSDVLPNHCPPTKRKAKFTKKVSAFRFLAGMLFRAIYLKLLPCLVLLFFELHDESSTAYRHALFKVSLVGFHFTCSRVFSGAFPTSGLHKSWCGNIARHHCHHVFESLWTRQSRPLFLFLRVDNFSIVTTNVCCRSLKHERLQLKQMEKWRNLPGAVRWVFSLFLVTMVIVSCSHDCLFDVSRLHGLTLRPSATVCCCRRDSLTRGRLAIVQEAVRVFFSSVFSKASARGLMCPVVTGSRRVMSLQALLKIGGPAITRNLLVDSPCSLSRRLHRSRPSNAGTHECAQIVPRYVALRGTRII